MNPRYHVVRPHLAPKTGDFVRLFESTAVPEIRIVISGKAYVCGQQPILRVMR